MESFPLIGRHLLLGGGGFIGRHVAVLLARYGAQVTICDRSPRANDFPEDVAESIRWRPFDRFNVDWDRLIADADAVHDYTWSSLPATANADPAKDLIINLEPLLGLLDALRRRGASRLIFSSSGGTVYGINHEIPVTERHPVSPITAYGASKATAEIYLGLYSKMYGVDTRVARIANAYGAGQNLSRGVGAIAVFLHKALQEEPIEIWGDGGIIRDYVHVADIAAFMTAFATAPRSERLSVLNVGSGVGTSLNAIVAAIEAAIQRKLDVHYMAGRSFDVPVSVLSIDKAKEVLDWKPRYSVSQGIAQTLKDLATHPRFSTLDNPSTPNQEIITSNQR